MQKRDGGKPGGMCASEVQALLDHNVLPHYTREVLEGRDPSEVPNQWDKACKEHAVRLGLEEHSSSVHFPFSLSLDNARVHTQAIKTLMMPREPPAEEANMLHEQCKKVLGATHLGSLAAMLKQAFKDSRFQLVKDQADAIHRQCDLAPLIGPFGRGSAEEVRALMSASSTNVAHCTKLLQLHDAFDAVIQKAPDKDIALAEFFAVCAIGRQANGMAEILQLLQSAEQCFAREVADRIVSKLEGSVMENTQTEFDTLRAVRMFARRQLACQLPQWRCLLPQQLMPLAIATPDLHAPAEVGVRTAKAPVRKLLASRPMSCPSLLKASTYQRFIQRKMDSRHRKGKDKHAARRCIDKLLCTAKILAAEAGQIVDGIRYTFDLKGQENYIPPEKQQLHEHVYGTAGGYVTDARFR